MKGLILNVICSWWSLVPESASVSMDGKRRVFIDQRVNVEPSVLEHVPMNKDAPGQVFLNKSEPGRVHLNKDAPGQVFLSKGAPGQVHLNKEMPGQVFLNIGAPGQVHLNKDARGQVFLNKGEPGRVRLNKGALKASPGKMQTNRNICKCGVGSRLGVKEIRERRRLLRHGMVNRCPLLSSTLPTCFLKVPQDALEVTDSVSE